MSLKKYKSQGKAVEVTVNNKEENSSDVSLDFVQEFGLIDGESRLDSAYLLVSRVFLSRLNRLVSGIRLHFIRWLQEKKRAPGLAVSKSQRTMLQRHLALLIKDGPVCFDWGSPGSGSSSAVLDKNLFLNTHTVDHQHFHKCFSTHPQ